MGFQLLLNPFVQRPYRRATTCNYKLYTLCHLLDNQSVRFIELNYSFSTQWDVLPLFFTFTHTNKQRVTLPIERSSYPSQTVKTDGLLTVRLLVPISSPPQNGCRLLLLS